MSSKVSTSSWLLCLLIYFLKLRVSNPRQCIFFGKIRLMNIFSILMNGWIFLEKSLFFSVPYPVPISVLQTRKNRNFVQYLGTMIKYDTDSGDREKIPPDFSLLKKFRWTIFVALLYAEIFSTKFLKEDSCNVSTPLPSLKWGNEKSLLMGNNFGRQKFEIDSISVLRIFVQYGVWLLTGPYLGTCSTRFYSCFFENIVKYHSNDNFILINVPFAV